MEKILLVVLGFIGADVVTGLTAAWFTRTVSSQKMRTGAQHKVAEILAMAATIGIDYSIPLLGLRCYVSFTKCLAVYLVIMETTSILENIIKLNKDLAGPLGKLLDKVKEVTGNGRDS